jgi:uncharacterized membrane protein YfcA
VSLVVVATALPFRTGTISFAEVGANWPIVVNLLGGSLIGAWVGAEWATRLRSKTLYRVIAVLGAPETSPPPCPLSSKPDIEPTSPNDRV